ncbi:MAG: glycosyltransferase family 2 protein [Fermentimonas sp.]|nr:glycosyltransferase family 2 protein [Fermentimonas sp.]
MITTKIKIKTAVVILNWNGKSLLKQFLPSVIEHTVTEDCRVIIADNGSTDDSVDFLKNNYPQLPLIILERNYGFADGYNKALENVDSEYVVLLNSDVETTSGWVTGLISFMDNNPHVAAVQPKILSYNEKDKFEYAGAAGGFIDKYGYPFCRGRILNTVERDEGQYDKEIDIFWATGACMCVRLRDYQEVGGLDGRFFAHMEEIDLCWRFNARGRKIMCIPSSIVYHVGGASLSKDNPKKLYLNFRNNLLMLYKNVTPQNFKHTFLFRYIFDFMAFSHLLLKGQFKSVKAVVKAYRDFFEMRKSYESVRAENISKIIVTNISSQYNKSILIKYYSGNKTFNSLIK